MNCHSRFSAYSILYLRNPGIHAANVAVNVQVKLCVHNSCGKSVAFFFFFRSIFGRAVAGQAWNFLGTLFSQRGAIPLYVLSRQQDFGMSHTAQGKTITNYSMGHESCFSPKVSNAAYAILSFKGFLR